MDVQKTVNYDKFKLLKGNRLLNPTHLRHLTTSIMLNNMLAYNPILVNEDFEVIDGQHRLEIARKNKLEIYYFIVPNAQLEETLMLNANNESWKINDYVSSYMDLGNQDYITLSEFKKHYNLNWSIAMGILMNLPLENYEILRTDLMKILKDGQFKVKDYDQAVKTAEIIMEFRPFTDGNTYRARGFITALFKTLLVIKQKKLLDKLSTYGKPMTKRTSVRDFLREFEDVLNYRSRIEVRL